MELEDRYGVRIPDEEAVKIKTVGQAAEYVAAHAPRKLPDALDTLASLLDELPTDLARQAFTHSSWVDQRWESYERLAFIGDVVLSLAVSTDLFPRFPHHGAGRLTKLRAQAVSRQACAQVARDLGVPERLRAAAPEGTGKSAEMLIESDRILASICEAVIGASYLAFGFDRVAPAVVDGLRRAGRGGARAPGRLQVRAAGAARPAGRGGRSTGSIRSRARRTTAASWQWPRWRGGDRPRRGKDQEERRAGGSAAGARPDLGDGRLAHAPALHRPEGLQVLP